MNGENIQWGGGGDSDLAHAYKRLVNVIPFAAASEPFLSYTRIVQEEFWEIQ